MSQLSRRTLRSLATVSVATAALGSIMALSRMAHAEGNDADGMSQSIPLPPPDTVYLRNDGMVRGRVQEILPGDHVTVTLATGESRRIAWVDVDRVIVASASTIPPLSASPPAAVPATPPALPRDPVPSPVVGPLVRVHIKTNGATLFRRPAGTTDIVKQCSAPCDADVPLEDEYRLAVSGSTSKPFHLLGAPGRVVELEISPASIGGVIAGGALAWAGGITVYVAGVLSAATCNIGQGCAGTLTAVGAGAVALALGVVVVVNNLSTDVSQQAGVTPGPTASSTASSTAFVRQPLWLSPKSPLDMGPSGVPSSAVVFPVFSATF